MTNGANAFIRRGRREIRLYGSLDLRLARLAQRFFPLLVPHHLMHQVAAQPAQRLGFLLLTSMLTLAAVIMTRLCILADS